MKKIISLILFPFLIIPFKTLANENFSVEIEALKLVMEQYKENTESNIELDVNNVVFQGKLLAVWRKI